MRLEGPEREKSANLGQREGVLSYRIRRPDIRSKPP